MPRTATTRLATLATMLTLALSTTALAHDYRQGDLTVDHIWARATAPQQQNGSAYFDVTNDGTSADRIVATASPVAGRVELHTHDVDSDGVMRMREVEAIDVPPGQTTSLAPGGVHVMLIGLAERLVEGDRFPLTIIFENAGALEVEVHVEAVTYGIGAEAGHDADHDPGHDHSH